MFTTHDLIERRLEHTESYQEKELLAQIAGGDQRAFALIVSRYTKVIYPHLLSYVKNAQKAEEITQDVFLRIWNNREKLTDIENFSGYIYVIARNRALTALKERLADAATASVDQLQDLLTRPESVPVELKELAIVLDEAINALPPRRKEVFMLSRKEGLTYEEIAGRLHISRSTVRQHIVEALAFLRNYLKEKLGIIVSIFVWLLLYGR